MDRPDTPTWPWLALALAVGLVMLYLAFFTPVRGLLVSYFSLEERQEEMDQPLPEDLIKKILDHVAEAKRKEMLKEVVILEEAMDELYAFRERRVTDATLPRPKDAWQALFERLNAQEALPEILREATVRDALGLSPLYDYARSMDFTADGLMKDTRALDLIARQGISDDEAFSLVAADYPGMYDLGPELTKSFESVRTRAELENFKALANTSIREVAMASERIRRFLEQMQNQWQFVDIQLEQEAEEEVPPEEEQAMEEQPPEEEVVAEQTEEQEQTEEAEQEEGEQTEVAEGEAQQAGEEGEQAEGEEGEQQGQEAMAQNQSGEQNQNESGEGEQTEGEGQQQEQQGITMQEGLAAMTPAERQALLARVAGTGKGEAQLVDMSDLMKGFDFTGGGQQDGSGFKYDPNDFPMSGSDYGVMESTNPTVMHRDKVLSQAVPARKISVTGENATRSGTVFIDSWYILGPFENDGKIKFDRLHSPDTELDLDREYTGKDGKPVRWNFNQSNEIKMLAYPLAERAVYFVYTEVWFDEAADIWIALGSDDAARFWVNDLLVFESSNTRHAWEPIEGFRKVHFRKGINRIRGRVETSPGTCHFSVILLPTLEPESTTN